MYHWRTVALTGPLSRVGRHAYPSHMANLTEEQVEQVTSEWNDCQDALKQSRKDPGNEEKKARATARFKIFTDTVVALDQLQKS